MTYTVSGANFNKDVATQGTSINYKENKTAKSEGVAGAFAGVVISGGVTAATDNTYEGLLKEADDVKSQIMASASDAKLSLKALMMKLSGADAVKLDEDGFNLTDATPHDMVNIVEKIKIELAMHSDDYVNYGTAVSKDKIESVTGSAAMAASIESRMQGADIAVNDESVAEVNGALEKSKELKPLSENTKNYMVANGIEPSIAGIYQAQAATSSSISADGVTIGKCADAISDADFEALRPGIEKIIASAGLEVNDKTLADARAFIDAQIPVTKENLEYKAQLDSIDIDMIQADSEELLNKIFDNMKLGGKAENTLVTGSPVDDIRTALDTINRAEYSDVANVVSKGETFTIASLKLEMDARSFRIEYSAATVSTGNSEVRNQASDVQQAADKAYDTLVTARVLMSANASIYLVKNNISILTTPIDELNSMLMEYEQADEMYEEAQIAYTDVLEARKTLNEIVRNPARVFASMFDKMNETYEAVGTQIRGDLGDSLKKAVQGSADDIIRELGLEGTDEDKEAIKVLAANNMDMTKENVEIVKSVNAMINNLIKNMKPETVLNMIKDGVNPMNTSIEEVNEYLTEANDKASKDNEEKFSKFLYKLDRTNGITKEQRKQFIGIYQMMNIFTRDAGVAAGALIKQGAEVTMNNLMTAYNSRKHYDMDAVIDENTGMAEVSGIANYYSALFMANGGLVTPNTLKNVDNSSGIGEQSVEMFIEQLEDNYDAAAEEQYYEEYLKEQQAAVQAGADILRQIRNADTEINSGNIQAVKAFLESGQFPDIRGVKTTRDYARDSIEKIGHKEKLSLMYEEMKDETEEELQEVLSKAGDLDTQIDVNYEEFLDLRLKDRTIGYIKNLALRHDYRIPYITDSGSTGMLKLTLVQDDDNKGRISVNMLSSVLGKVSVEAKADRESLGMYIVSDTAVSDEGCRLLDDMEESLKEAFGFTDVFVNTTKSSDIPYVTYEAAADSVATDKLYEIAAQIVKLLAG
ncbi:DUF6240 domain-containing protein [Lachnospira eligens]|uniref:DUF6240 domain-containing protein n=1 Tax=Lachnospira eligens TaxID=39485 RepID=UPI000E4B77A5|nr:DUF6240 domain-containing protein [Lachnospira eligens]RHM11738.1 hypothetical protein DWZ79_08160 [Lachnospira eligens]HBA11884.1 hypothetical protein [Eubacterium sp.]